MYKARLAVYHSGCGGILGYVDDPGKDKTSSENFSFLDGTKPESGSNLELPCKLCGKTITEFANMTAQMFDSWDNGK